MDWWSHWYRACCLEQQGKDALKAKHHLKVTQQNFTCAVSSVSFCFLLGQSLQNELWVYVLDVESSYFACHSNGLSRENKTHFGKSFLQVWFRLRNSEYHITELSLWRHNIELLWRHHRISDGGLTTWPYIQGGLFVMYSPDIFSKHCFQQWQWFKHE